MKITVQSLLSRDKSLLEYGYKCRQKTQELINDLEVLFYAYGFLSVAIPTDLSESNALCMKRIIMDGDELYRLFDQLLQRMQEEDEDFEDAAGWLAKMIGHLEYFDPWFGYLRNVAAALQESVQTYCPHADSSDAFWKTSHLVLKDADALQEDYVVLTERIKVFLMRLEEMRMYLQEIDSIK